MTVAHEVPPQGFRTFVLLWASQSVSALGSALTLFAVNIWLTQVRYPLAAQKPQLALALSWTSLSFMLPTIFAGPLAGAWADRHDRRRTMMAMNFSAFLLSGAFVGLLVSGRLDVWVLLGFLAVYALLGAFHTASFETSYAMLVPVSQVARATGMMQTTMALSYVISPALAARAPDSRSGARRGFAPDLPGAPIAHLADGTALAVGIDCATFLLATVALLGLHVPSPHRPDLAGPGAARKTLWHDIREGGLFVWHRRPMLWLIGTFAAANFMLGPITVMQPLLVKFDLAHDWRAHGFTFETALALLATAHGLGGLGGAIGVSSWGGLKRRRVVGVLVPIALGGALCAGYGFSPFIYLSASLLFVMGAGWPISNAHSSAIWFQITPREIQGRVLSVRRLIGWMTYPMGVALAGWLGARFDPGMATAALGVCLAAFALLQLVNPMLMRIEDRAWLEAFAARSERRGAPAAEPPAGA